MARTFTDAVKTLRRFQTSKPANDSISYLFRDSPDGSLQQVRGKPHLERMSQWLKQLGHEDAINGIEFIHVAGTKGKGSTCAYIDALLRAHSKRTGRPLKIGLYTSPHLMDETERIRIQGRPISKELFAKYAWEVIDALSSNPDKKTFSNRSPGFLQSMFLISIHVFLAEKVNVAIIEVHTGGRFCATNAIQYSVITVITSLLLDHMPELGNDIESIAWHKAGIFETGTAAFSTHKIMKSFANTQIFSNEVQRQNFSLAYRVCIRLLLGKQQMLTDEDIRTAAKEAECAGRFQTLSWRGVEWYLDVAHSESCIEEPVKWFKQSSGYQTDVTRVVVFAHTANPRRRDGGKLLARLAETLKDNNVVPDYFFLTKDRNEGVPRLLEEYKGICSSSLSSHVELQQSLEQVFGRITRIKQQSKTVHVLITGSVFLVGDALRLLNYTIA